MECMCLTCLTYGSAAGTGMASLKLASAADKTKNRWGFDTAFIESWFAVVLASGV